MGKCCDPQAPRPVLVDVGGARVGIVGLEEVLAEVHRLRLADEARIKQELLGRVRRQNYVAPGAEEKYAAALCELYRERYAAGKAPPHRGGEKVRVIKVLGPGCPKCQTLEEEVRRAVADLGIEVKIEKVADVNEVVRHGVMITPALVVDGQLKASGRVPAREEIKGWLE